MPSELFAKNFTCPDFYTCTLKSSLDQCKNYIGDSVNNFCQNVSTEWLGVRHVPCFFYGKCYQLTGFKYPIGPEQYMAMVHQETREKIYNYITSNWHSLAGVGVGILTLGALIKLVRMPNEYLETRDERQLSAMLDYADVSTGHWNGSRIHFFWVKEYATFSNVANRIEQLYANSIKFMRDRQESYESSQKPTKPLLSGVSGKPILSEIEEAQVQGAIQWRENAYGQLNALFAKSLTKENRFTRIWNRALDKVSSWKAKDTIKDQELLKQMVANRPIKQSEPVKPEEKPPVVVEEKITPSRLTFAKEAIWNVARLVRDLALTVLYSIWIFSTSWKSNIATSARNVAEDFSNLRNAMLGIFSPESASS
jgi:hypothetical protein